MNPIHSEKDLDTLRRSTTAYAVLAAWSDAGLFKALADRKSRTAAEIPADSRAVEISAPVLAHLGLLIRDGERWALSSIGAELEASGALQGFGAADAMGDLSRLDSVIRDGGPVRSTDGSSRVSEGGVREQDPEGARRFMAMLYRRSANTVGEVALRIRDRLPEAARLLDLGGGHGRYGEAMHQEGCKVTLFDRPICVDIARERYGDKFNYLSGDFMKDPLGGPYDIVFLSNIVHGLGPEENRALFLRCREALCPQGILVIKDMFIDALGAFSEQATIFGLTMLMYTREGKSYGLSEISNILGGSGFASPEQIYISDAGYSLLLATPASTK